MIALLEFSPRGIPAVTIYASEHHLQVARGKPDGIVMRSRVDFEKQLRLHGKNDWAKRVLEGIDVEAFSG